MANIRQTKTPKRIHHTQLGAPAGGPASWNAIHQTINGSRGRSSGSEAITTQRRAHRANPRMRLPVRKPARNKRTPPRIGHGVNALSRPTLDTQPPGPAASALIPAQTRTRPKINTHSAYIRPAILYYQSTSHRVTILFLSLPLFGLTRPTWLIKHGQACTCTCLGEHYNGRALIGRKPCWPMLAPVDVSLSAMSRPVCLGKCMDTHLHTTRQRPDAARLHPTQALDLPTYLCGHALRRGCRRKSHRGRA